MADEAKTVEARAKQREASKRSTLDLMKNKKKATETFSLFLIDDDNEQVELKITFQAMGAVEYDKLMSKHPPTAEQRVEGANFNLETFGPALISRVSIDPEMSEADALEIWNAPEWSRGDVMVLFRHAVELNNRGMDIPFTVTG